MTYSLSAGVLLEINIQLEYVLTWKGDIMKDLNEMSLMGGLSVCIDLFKGDKNG